MTAIDKFVQQVRARELDNYLRDMGFQRCGECDEFTDHKDADDEPCCETCLQECVKQQISEDRYNDNRRF